MAKGLAGQGAPKVHGVLCRGFLSVGLDGKGWERHKYQINKRYGQIEITIRNLKVKVLSSERATACFDQEYRADKYRDQGRKTIKLIERDGKWKIKKEA